MKTPIPPQTPQSINLSNANSIFLIILSFIIVAFGQPAWSVVLGVVAAIIGYALFFRVLLTIASGKKRFWCACFWFTAVQAVQLSWLLTHPFNYVYALYSFLSFAMGLQFGIVGWFVTPDRVRRISGILAIAGTWTLLEWLRLFFLSGFTFNPIGLALTSTLWGLQGATIGGLYGLSFYVMLTNLFLLQNLYLLPKRALGIGLSVLIVLLPYLFGYWHVRKHEDAIEAARQDPAKTLTALLVQTAFPIEETLPFATFAESVAFIQNEWATILKMIKPYQAKNVELIALPEYVVPYGTYLALYPLADVLDLFTSIFGEEVRSILPELNIPLAMEVETKAGKQWKVTNAYFCQAIANIFNADLVAGLQDDQWTSHDTMCSYSSGFYFWPKGAQGLRYEKRILLPMGEYIPFECLQKMAKEYGVSGSFTFGKGAKVFPGCKVPFGLSICYEETFGDIMRDNRLKGAEVLINLTSDVWYPNSRLPKQHFDHARLRSVELGIPLVRACNTGITGAFDSIGRIVASLSAEAEWEQTALLTEVPLYHYRTLYTYYGDMGILAVSTLALFGLFRRRKE